MGRKTNPSEFVGKKYGRLVIENIIFKRIKNGSNTAHAVCKCECGKTYETLLAQLKYGRVKSCGCLKDEKAGLRRKTHGMSNTRFFKIWQGILKRCNNSNSESYKNYGGRGIVICKRWEDFSNFKIDMYDSYVEHIGKFGENNTSIDRKDNNGSYEPSNCRWATRKEQNENTRTVKRYPYKGKMLSLHQISDMEGINYRTLRNRIFRSGMTIEQAVNHKTGSKVCKNNTRYEYEGKQLRLYELSEISGIHPATLKWRLKNMGMSASEAINTPVRKRGDS